MKINSFLLAISISCTITAQNFDQLLSNRRIDCTDISYNGGVYFKKYIEENKQDSAKQLLQYWESKCGHTEPVFRAGILLSLSNGTFHDSILTEGIFNQILQYQNRMSQIKYPDFYIYDFNSAYYGFIPPGQEFDNYTRNLAVQLKNNYDPNSMEYLFCEFYGNNPDTLFSMIQSDSYASSYLGRKYQQIVNSYLKMSEYHLAGFTGIWIPTGELKTIGPHPELGLQVGLKQRKMNYDLTLSFKFIQAKNEYLSLNSISDSMEYTRHFFGGNIGIDVGRDIIVQQGHEVQVIGGIAYDGFDTFKDQDDDDDNNEGSSVNSYDFNFGIGYRFYITNTTYIGVKAKYHIVDYTLNDRIDFTGNPITVHLYVGSVNNAVRNGNLTRFRYKLRK